MSNLLYFCLCVCVLAAGVSVCHLSDSDRHHCGLQGGSAWLSRWPPVGVFPEPLLPLWHWKVSGSHFKASLAWLRVCVPHISEHRPHFTVLQFVFLSPRACREKFWRVGNKERDGEYGACFFPQNRGLLVGQPPLLYCARPGSRIWEANFNGDVLSTHQFKQLLACPPLPLITYRYWLSLHLVLVFFPGKTPHLSFACVSTCRNEPHYNSEQKSPQSVAFPKLLYLG